MPNPEELKQIPEEYRGQEELKLSEIEVEEGEAEQLLNQAVNLEDALWTTKEETARLTNSKERRAFKQQKEAELLGEMSREEAAKLLKAVSTRASGTKETPLCVLGMGGPEKEGYSIPVEKDPHSFNTYDSAEGVLQWIDDEGARWVTLRSYITGYLVEQLGLKEKWQWVPHSSDGGMWMMYHSPFWREIQIQELKAKLRGSTSMTENVREGIEEKIARIKESDYSPKAYEEAVERVKKEKTGN